MTDPTVQPFNDMPTPFVPTSTFGDTYTDWYNKTFSQPHNGPELEAYTDQNGRLAYKYKAGATNPIYVPHSYPNPTNGGTLGGPGGAGPGSTPAPGTTPTPTPTPTPGPAKPPVPTRGGVSPFMNTGGDPSSGLPSHGSSEYQGTDKSVRQVDIANRGFAPPSSIKTALGNAFKVVGGVSGLLQAGAASVVNSSGIVDPNSIMGKRISKMGMQDIPGLSKLDSDLSAQVSSGQLTADQAFAQQKSRNMAKYGSPYSPGATPTTTPMNDPVVQAKAQAARAAVAAQTQALNSGSSVHDIIASAPASSGHPFVSGPGHGVSGPSNNGGGNSVGSAGDNHGQVSGGGTGSKGGGLTQGGPR